jgi:hypothetical protein
MAGRPAGVKEAEAAKTPCFGSLRAAATILIPVAAHVTIVAVASGNPRS